MGFIETMSRPILFSERKNSTERSQTVPLKLKTTLSEAYFEAPKQGVLRVVLNFESFDRGVSDGDFWLGFKFWTALDVY